MHLLNKIDRYKNIYTENEYRVCECEHHSLNNNSVSNLQLEIECHIFTVFDEKYSIWYFV